MGKKLVAYFSASGVTKKVAPNIINTFLEAYDFAGKMMNTNPSKEELADWVRSMEA